MLIDMHTHTKPRSSCSNLNPDELVSRAKEMGLDAVCFTEHDRLWEAEAVRALGRSHDFLVLRGLEATTELGHMLVFGLERLGAGIYQAERLRQEVETAGGVMFLCHPLRGGGHGPDEGLAALVDGLEVFNGTNSAAENALAQRMAERLGLPGLGGSDAHVAADVGSYATRFERAVATEAELLAELKARRFQPVDLRFAGW